MIVWTGPRTSNYQGKAEAEAKARELGGRAEWQDEYNDYSILGRWIVRK